jgi:hypothetical protein
MGNRTPVVQPVARRYTDWIISPSIPKMMKENIKLSLYKINETLYHKDEEGSGGIAVPFLTSSLDGGELSALRLGRFTPGEKVPGTHLIGGRVARKPVCTFWSREK